MGPNLGAVKEETISKEKPKEIVFINEGGIAKVREVKNRHY